LNYLSVCSGIEAATAAWHSLGWNPVAFSEIEPFPCKVLAHHYPVVPNHGDMTKFKEWPDYANLDVLVGGTPCQSFSVAGLRKGLDDPRGNLMLTYLAIADRYKPKWLLWENVPGVLSSWTGPTPPSDLEPGQRWDSEETSDFGCLLEGLAELGYGFAYRILDAQFVRTDGHPYAVPQRRRRVFVVGCLGSWQRAAAVLFDTESLRGNPPPSREKGKEVAGTIASRTTACGGLGTEFDLAGGLQAVARDVSPTLTKKFGGASNQWAPYNEADHLLPVVCMAHGQGGAEITEGYAPTLNCNHEQPIALVGNTINRKPHNGGNGTGFDESGAMYTLTNTDVHAVCLPINTQIATRHEAMGDGTGMGIGADGDAAYTLQAAHSHAVAFRTNAAGQINEQDGISASLGTQTDPCAQFLQQKMQVRRLTPLECERLQGFPDNYTNIPGASDSARYKALGNSMAVNVMQLIGQRIQMVEAIA